MPTQSLYQWHTHMAAVDESKPPQADLMAVVLREDLIEIMPCIKAARSAHSLPLGLI